MSNNILYGRPSENVTANATITASAPDATYPAANLGDLDPAGPSKLAATSGAWLFDFGSAQRLDVVALIHHNLTAGLDVRLEGDTSNGTWLTPPLSAHFTIPTYHEDGFPVNPWIDVTGASGYSTSGYRFWRVAVYGTNAANVAIGEVVMQRLKRQFEINIAWGAQDGEDRQVIEHRSAGGVVFAYNVGTKQRRLQGQVPDTTDVGMASLLSLHRDARGRAKPFLLVPDASVNDALFVRWGASAFTRTMQMTDVNGVPVAFEELSRGLPL